MFAQGGLCELILLCLPALQHVSLSVSVTENGNVYATRGDKVTLPCRMNCPPRTQVTKAIGKWERQRREGNSEVQTIVQFLGTVPQRGTFSLAGRSNVHNSHSSGNFGLVITNVQAEDSGTFSCEFHFKQYTAQATVQLYVVQVTSNSSNPVLQGEGVSLRCHTPAGQVSWTGPHGVQRTENPLLFERTSLQDVGQWTCGVEFTNGESLRNSYQLEVIGFTEPLDETIYLPAGSSALLPCSLNRFPSSGSAGGSWLRGGTELVAMNVSASGWEWLPPRDSYLQAGAASSTGNLSVSISGAVLSAGAEYQCQLRLHMKSISRTVRVNVIQVKASPPGPVTVGSNVSLECLLSHSSQFTQLCWRHNRSSSPGTVSKQGRRSHTIDLISVTRREEGEWICEIIDSERTVGKATYTLNVTEPSASLFGNNTLILIVGIASSLVVLIVVFTLTAICLNRRARRRRRALRRLRHPLCREHSYQLSNQPLCNSNDYTQGERPLPPLPRYCPHQPRRGRPSHAKSSRRGARPQYMA